MLYRYNTPDHKVGCVAFPTLATQCRYAERKRSVAPTWYILPANFVWTFGLFPFASCVGSRSVPRATLAPIAALAPGNTLAPASFLAPGATAAPAGKFATHHDMHRRIRFLFAGMAWRSVVALNLIEFHADCILRHSLNLKYHPALRGWFRSPLWTYLEGALVAHR